MSPPRQASRAESSFDAERGPLIERAEKQVEQARSEINLSERGSSSISPAPTHSSKPRKHLWKHIRGKDRERISWMASLKAIIFCSLLNALLPIVPAAWAVFLAKKKQNEMMEEEGHKLVISPLLYVALVPLERLFDWGGEQLAMYCGPGLGDLIVITLNNIVEATLALCLLTRCELRLVHSTITGVVLLRLLWLPGTAFLIGGARIRQQHLSASRVQLNQVLLITGVMTLLAPAAYFNVLNSSINVSSTDSDVTDASRGELLKMGRGASVILLILYVCSRVYLHNPPGESSVLYPHPDAHPGEVERADELSERVPEVNPYACILLLLVTVAAMAVTAEFLVEDIDPIKNFIGEEYFGIFLLPLVSNFASRLVCFLYFIRSTLRHWFGKPEPPSTLQESKSIDLSIQFLMFWTPIIVLVGWVLDKPMHLLFDAFEIAILVGACFVVNYVTADARTNWPEGCSLVAFYAILALVTWFYPGQTQMLVMNACTTITEALAGNATAARE